MAGVIQSAIESFAQELAGVLQRFLKLEGWKDASRIVIGGGFSGSRVGELAIGRASVLLKTDGIKTEICIIRKYPDEAGLVGAVHLAPTWMFEAHDAILAVDIGGTNIRAGVVQLNLRGAADLSKAKVWNYELWRHGDEKLIREEAVDGSINMLQRLIKRAEKEELRLAPFIGIGCPGRIDSDGSIEAGAQNLPGNWESSRFNLPATVLNAIPRIGDHETAILMHNDAVVQGLSEAPFMNDVEFLGCVHHRHRPRQRALHQSRPVTSLSGYRFRIAVCPARLTNPPCIPVTRPPSLLKNAGWGERRAISNRARCGRDRWRRERECSSLR